MQPNDMFSPDAIHVALDLETLGTTPGSVILQIGAQAFTASESILGIQTMCDIYIDSLISYSAGFHKSPDTVDWWNNQNPETRRCVFSGTTAPYQALMEFNTYMKGLGDKRSVYLWGNSNRFDCGLLEAYYRHYGQEIPWDFRNERDFRTLTALYPHLYASAKMQYTNEEQHNGYWDARWESCIIEYILKGGRI